MKELPDTRLAELSPRVDTRRPRPPRVETRVGWAEARAYDEIKLSGFHPSQRLVASSDARFRVLACGRRWGKTRLASALAFEVALRGGRAWWVAPTYPLSRVGWRMLKGLARPLVGVGRAQVREGERMVYVPAVDGWVQVRSAHDPDSLVSEGLDFVVLDECALMREEAWEVALRPALADREGRAMFISTPRGRNWFWRLYMRAEGGEAGWAAWHFPSWDNPYLGREEVEAARREMTERVFRQEFGAEFMEDGAGVFRNVYGSVDPYVVEESRGPYVFGVDWGRVNDYTVVVVVDVGIGGVVRVERMGGMGYEEQLGKLREMYEVYRPRVVVAEVNGMGGPLVERLVGEGMVVRGVWMDQRVKGELVEGLALAMERGEVRMVDDVVLQGELLAYEVERLPGGGYRYGAPSGMHDDCVMALALAWGEVGGGALRGVVAGWRGGGVGIGDSGVELVREGGRVVFRRSREVGYGGGLRFR